MSKTPITDQFSMMGIHHTLLEKSLLAHARRMEEERGELREALRGVMRFADMIPDEVLDGEGIRDKYVPAIEAARAILERVKA